MNILQIVTSVGPCSFGLGPVALNLTREQIDLGNESRIWCLDSESDRRWASTVSGLPLASIRNFSIRGPHRLGYSSEMERAVFQGEERIDIVHQHGIWTGISRVTNKLRLSGNVKTVVGPHGSLEPWCLNVSKFKKRLALFMYENKNLRSADCIHVCSTQELASCRDYGLDQPIAVIPNGIASSWFSQEGNAHKFKSKFNVPTDRRVILFLSRIHPKKGIPLLFDAILSKEHGNDFMLVIAGVDEGGHEAELKELAAKLNLNQVVKFIGPVFGDDKLDAFAAADVLILPTHSENFGIVVIEALGAGVPVITTKGAPWKDLLSYDCGWWVDVDSVAIAEALKAALTLSTEQLRNMGQRGRELVASKYTWTKSAQLTIELYEWLLGRREKPGFVVVD